MADTAYIGTTANDGTGDPLRVAFAAQNAKIEALQAGLAGSAEVDVNALALQLTLESAAGASRLGAASGKKVQGELDTLNAFNGVLQGPLGAQTVKTLSGVSVQAAIDNVPALVGSTVNAAADRAEAASDAAQHFAGIKDDTADGLSTTSVGDYFSVPSADNAEYLVLYRHDAGPVAVEVKRSPAATIGLTVRDLQLLAGLPVSTRKVVEASGSITPSVFRAFSFVSGTAYEIVAVAQADERGFLNLICTIAGGANCTFDLAAGTATGAGSSIRSLGGGFYECLAAFTPTASASNNAQARLSPGGTLPYTGDGASGLILDSLVLRTVGSTTNLLPSSNPADASFTKVSCSVAAATSAEARLSAAVDAHSALLDTLDAQINGRLSADKLVEAAGSVSPSCYQSVSWVSGTAYIIEAEAKAAERTRLNLFCAVGAVFNATFDLAAGTATGAGASITALGNGCYRCRVDVTAGATAVNNLQARVFPAAGAHPYTGDGTSGLYLESMSMRVGAGANLLTSPTNFAAAAWTKQNMSIVADSGLWLGMPPASATPDTGAEVWAGKKVAVIGTSITAQAQFTVPLAEALGLNLVNLGVGGASLASGSSGGSLVIYNSITSIPADSAAVIVEAGTNDFGTDNSDLGALLDTTTATFYGALWAAVVAIRTQAPSAKIIFLTPYSGGSAHATHRHFRTNTKGHTLRQFQKAVEEVAALAGYPCIDVGQRSGIGYHTGALYMTDNLHINATGGLRFASYVAEQMRELGLSGFMA